MASGKDLELNETGWWSHWADVRWNGERSYVMLSSVFDEYFFNRAGFVGCADGQDDVAKIEAEFEASERPPCFSVQGGCEELIGKLNARGYTKFDEMAVMQLGQPRFKKATSLKVLRGPDVKTTEWAATYLLSFYGDLSLNEPVARIVERLALEPSVALFAGEKDGKTVGVLGAFRSPGLLGVYCIGTLGEHRGMGIAGALIHEVSAVASAEGRLLVLQTIVSDRVEDFYTRGGFRRLYLKHLMRPETSGLNRPERG
ncbi:MAG: GNAT family N-acetyltransferase [Thaumarchaeota archaeon]|nr:GNAT family N-acetyltransferase [Nitrososphaerota archaeon]